MGTKKEKDAMKVAAAAAAARGKAKPEDVLRGSGTLPDTIDIGGGERVPTSDVVAAAYARSGLDVLAWNALTDAERGTYIDKEVGLLRDEALNGLDPATQPGTSPLLGAAKMGERPTGVYPTRPEPVTTSVAQDHDPARAIAAQAQTETDQGGAPTAQPSTPAPELEDLVPVDVPRGFNLTLDDRRVVPIARGSQRLPRAWAEHWYSKANGVKLV